MPWRLCTSGRDTITTDEGYAVNFYELDDVVDVAIGAHSPYEVKSHCRVADGQWVAWIGKGFGNQLGDGTLSDEWPSLIANASWAWVGYFPDDGSPPTVFDLPLWACFDWFDGRYSRMGVDGKECAIKFVLPGIYFAPNQKSELTRWFSGAHDIQVRTDGNNVWAVVLAQESIRYPWLSRAKRIDKCGVGHAPITALYEGNGEDFTHDTTSVGESGLNEDTWWSQSNVNPGDQDDQGVNASFRWQPARITVFSGGIGGFNKLTTIDAKFNNCADYGLLGHVEACASPAEPGVLHVMWAEGGFCRDTTTGTDNTISWDGVQGLAGQRINYSRWSPTTEIFDNDIASSFDSTDGHGHDATSFSGEWVWTDEYILRNDHGSCAAFIWSWATDPDPSITREFGPTTLDPNEFAYFDMTSGAPVFVQLFDTSLIPTPAETGLSSVIPAGSITTFGNPSNRPDSRTTPGRNIYASGLYTDPLLEDTDVYLIGANFTASGSPFTPAQISAFYRIPVDASATFDFLDGVRLMQFSIVNPGTDRPRVAFSDFVSDPGNIWVPTFFPSRGGGGVWHLVRTCERTWELLQAFPDSLLPDAGVDLSGGWAEFEPAVIALNSPPSIVTDDSGNDWLAAGGVVPPGQSSGNNPFYAAALRARICRCCVPCIERIGLHVWQVL